MDRRPRSILTSWDRLREIVSDLLVMFDDSWKPFPYTQCQKQETHQITHDFFQKGLVFGVADHHKSIQLGEVVRNVDQRSEKNQGEAGHDLVPTGYAADSPDVSSEDQKKEEKPRQDCSKDLQNDV